jgi:hypothetical protein
MNASALILIEIVMFFGGFIAFALYQIRTTKKAMRKPGEE